MVYNCEKVNEKLLSEIKHLDEQYYPDTIVGLDWYTDRYINLEYISTIRDANNILLGYCCITGISKEIYDKMREGVIWGDLNIEPQEFKRISESNYLYLSMIVITDSIAKKGMGTKLTQFALESTNKSKYNVVCIATNERALNILKRLEFKEENSKNNKVVCTYKVYEWL